MTNGKIDIVALAKLGAQAELEMHRDSITSLERFLKRRSPRRARRAKRMRPAKRRLSAAARKAISRRMKKMWRAKRATAQQ